VPKYVIEITLPDIEYLKSAAVLDSDKLKLISLPFFIRDLQLNCLMHTLPNTECGLLNTSIADGKTLS
jgi:hypothetical protein